MNRFVADGLLNEMHQGKRVMVACESNPKAREAFMKVIERIGDADPRIGKVCRGAADWSVHGISGGVVRFGAYRGGSQLRGTTADLVYVEGEDINELTYLNLALCAVNGELVHA